MSPTIHITQGLPASGKTTFARTLEVARFNMDDYRSMLGLPYSRERESLVKDAMIRSACAALDCGHDIVIDNTHLNPGLLKQYRKAFTFYSPTYQVHSFTDVPLEECIRRDHERGLGTFARGYVGRDVIERLAVEFAAASRNGWKLTPEWMSVSSYVKPEPYVRNGLCPAAFLVDLDGTVAHNNGHRGFYDYTKVIDDEPIWDVIDAVRRHANSGLRPIFMSGRMDSCREDTIRWIEHHFHGLKVGPYQMQADLHMRRDKDQRPDWLVKNELFDAHVRSKYNVKFVYDDRNQVVRMWRDLGLTVFQVAEGDF